MPVFLPDIFSMIRKNRFDDGKENDMEDEVKKLPLKWELGEEQVAFQVDSYAMTGGIYVGLLCDNGEYYEPFADMTVCIPGYSLEPNEAFINGDMSRDLLNFIKENDLGKILPYQVRSGYGKYTPVAFDLEKLQELDPEGVKRFKQEHDIPDKKPKKKKQKSRDPER
jgi:hypothetical protein